MQLWSLQAEPGASRRWKARSIPEGGLALALDAAGALSLEDGTPREGGVLARLLPLTLRGSREIVLVAAPDARGLLVGGFPPLAVALLDDRAEIRVAAETFYLTRSAPTAVERFDALGAESACLRCTRALRPGDSVLRCGGCGGLHHEGERAEGLGALRCASYDRCCAGCRRSWEAVHWTPEALE